MNELWVVSQGLEARQSETSMPVIEIVTRESRFEINIASDGKLVETPTGAIIMLESFDRPADTR